MIYSLPRLCCCREQCDFQVYINIEILSILSALDAFHLFSAILGSWDIICSLKTGANEKEPSFSVRNNTFCLGIPKKQIVVGD